MGDGARPVIFASLLLDCRVFIYIYFAAESTRRRKYRTAAFFAFSPHKKHYHPVYIRLYYNNSITQLSSVLGKKHKKARRFWLFCAKRGNKARGPADVCTDGQRPSLRFALAATRSVFSRCLAEKDSSSLRSFDCAMLRIAPLRMTDALHRDNSNRRRRFVPSLFTLHSSLLSANAPRSPASPAPEKTKTRSRQRRLRVQRY